MIITILPVPLDCFIIVNKSLLIRGDTTPKPVVRDPQEPWSLTTTTAFKLLTSARLCAALWNILTDCDEVFNYWEPVSAVFVLGPGILDKS